MDFEDYQPIFYLIEKKYSISSYEWAAKVYPQMPLEFQFTAGHTAFETSAKILFQVINVSTFKNSIFRKISFQSLLQEGARLRPKAKWGYYHYPYCRNVCTKGHQCNHVVQFLIFDTINVFKFICFTAKSL